MDVTLPVHNPKGGEKGSFSIKLLFQPESEHRRHQSVSPDSPVVVIARSRQKTSTFSMAGRAVTQIGGLPFAAGKGVVHGGGAVAMGAAHGIGHVGGFAGRRMGLMRKRDTSGKEIVVPATIGATSEIGSPKSPGFDVPAGQVSQPVNGDAVDQDTMPAGAAATTLPPGVGSPSTGAGVLHVTVMSAKDINSEEGGGAKPYVQLKMAGRTFKTDHVKGLQPEW